MHEMKKINIIFILHIYAVLALWIFTDEHFKGLVLKVFIFYFSIIKIMESTLPHTPLRDHILIVIHYLQGDLYLGDLATKVEK